jgi:RNA-directed DNA polymerase
MEEALEIKHYTRGDLNSTRAVVRYADDFCVFCESQEDAETAQQVLTDWLSERGLTLSAEKTTIVHLMEGLNFLGFHIRLYRASNTKTGRRSSIASEPTHANPRNGNNATIGAG